MMSGTLVVSGEACWMPAGWVFNNVLEGIARHIHNDATAVDMLLKARTSEGGGYLDLSGLGTDKIEMILAAAQSAYSEFEQKGEAALLDPTFFTGFMTQFKNLISMLAAETQSRSK